MEGSTTRPFVCRCDDGRTYYVKGRDAGRSSQINELIAAQLALKIGLPTPIYHVLEVPEDLIIDTAGMELEDLGSGLCFGSQLVEHTTEFKITEISDVDIETQLKVYFFDLWVQNGDRTLSQFGGNPNLLWDYESSSLVAFDHNLAFDRDFNENELLKSHVFKAAYLTRHDHDVTIAQIRSNFCAALTDWQEIRDSIPDEWFYTYGDDTLKYDYDLDRVGMTLDRILKDDFWR